MKGYFITGTDTGVGKTFVSAMLAELAREAGLRVFAFKPIETGCRPEGEDQRALWKAAGQWQTGELRGVYQLRDPVAPAVAATAEGISIDLGRVIRVGREGAAQADITIVEGAGGWRVPVTNDADMSVLAKSFGLPVIVVARATLGTINHSLLTLEAVKRDGLEIAALVMSLRPDEDPVFARSNAKEIGERWSGSIITVPHEKVLLRTLL